MFTAFAKLMENLSYEKKMFELKKKNCIKIDSSFKFHFFHKLFEDFCIGLEVPHS